MNGEESRTAFLEQQTFTMKKIITFLTTAALVAVAHAQAPEGPKGPKGHRKGPHGGPPPEIVAKFDLDGDGKLNKEERKAAHEAMKEHRRAKKQEHRQKMLEQFDTDGDGKLSEEERKAARESRGKGRKGPDKKEPDAAQ